MEESLFSVEMSLSCHSCGIYSLALAFLCLVASTKAFCLDPATVPELNLTAYLGTWYQLAEDPLTQWFTEKGAVCATATYGLNPNGTVSILNFARIGDPQTGKVYTIEGWAYPYDKANPGHLWAYLVGTPSWGFPYWVLQAGPINQDGLYSYAIVSDEVCGSLFVISRTPTLTQATWKTIQTFLTKTGFEGLDGVVKMVQNGCKYGN